MRILCFGDSIIQGYWDTQGGWVQRLRTYYDELQLSQGDSDLLTIFNLGISGETSSGLVKRFSTEAATRADQPVIFIFGIGTNDTIFRGEQYDSTPEEYIGNLTKILEQAKEFSDKILFVGLGPVIDEQVQPMKWSSTGKCYATDRIWMFEQALREFCKENQVQHVPIFEAFKEGISKGREVFADGAHPNNDGHQLIFELIRPQLDQLLSS